MGWLVICLLVVVSFWVLRWCDLAYGGWVCLGGLCWFWCFVLGLLWVGLGLWLLASGACVVWFFVCWCLGLRVSGCLGSLIVIVCIAC